MSFFEIKQDSSRRLEYFLWKKILDVTLYDLFKIHLYQKMITLFEISYFLLSKKEWGKIYSKAQETVII